MYKSLNAPAIGIRGKTLAEVAALARETGYGGVDLDMTEAKALADATSVAGLTDTLGDLRPGGWGLPVEGEQTEWEVDLDKLDACAALAEQIGAPRCYTWVPSWSDSHELDENIAFHIDRLRPAAAVLADHGCRLGLEFLGPRTLLDGHRFPFLRTMEAMLDMGREIGPNVGLLMDAWHLHASGGTLEDLAELSEADIVHVHINDAPKGVPVNALIDNERCLPGETGVLDLTGFLRELAKLGYDGPVVTEPFNARLNEVAASDPAAAAAEVSAAMDRLFEASDLR